MAQVHLTPEVETEAQCESKEERNRRKKREYARRKRRRVKDDLEELKETVEEGKKFKIRQRKEIWRLKRYLELLTLQLQHEPCMAKVLPPINNEATLMAGGTALLLHSSQGAGKAGRTAGASAALGSETFDGQPTTSPPHAHSTTSAPPGFTQVASATDASAITPTLYVNFLGDISDMVDVYRLQDLDF